MTQAEGEADEDQHDDEAGDQERALPFVGADLFEHLGRSEREVQHQNCTLGTSRDASSASKYSRFSNFIMRAKITDGNAWSLLL